MEKIWNFLSQVGIRSWVVLGEMSPWVLGGFAVAGVLSLWLNARVVRSHFGGGRLSAIVKAVLLGIPLPVCSCGVIPLGASLREHGAGKGPTAAFLMSTPQTGVDSIAVTFGMMGGLFAVFRPLAALVSGVACGVAVEAVAGDEPAENLVQKSDVAGAELKPWWVRVLQHGFGVLPRSVGGALVLGAVVSAVVSVGVPENWIATNFASPLWQMVLMLAVGIPMYICSTAAVPFVLGLMVAGLSPGAAMAFLVGGPGVSASTVLAMWKLLGARATVVYVAVLVACAIGFGLWVQWWLPSGWLPAGVAAVEKCAHGLHAVPWRVHLQAGILLAVIGLAKMKRFKTPLC